MQVLIFISVHAETCTHLHRTIQLIKNFNVKAGVALNPATSIESVKWIINDIDFIVVMSVNPGFGGQKFIKSSLEKIENLKSLINKKGSKAIIQVDGGVGMSTINKIAQAGAKSFVAGSAIFHTSNYKETISALKQQIMKS